MIKNNSSQILVSICCVTYNHESFIRQTIESFVNQKTNFNYEIIIHNDASTDNSGTIIHEYQKQYPQKISIIDQKENQYSKGCHPLLAYVLPSAKGKYIALCDGDDYWLDNNKLQFQVDFLEKNTEYSGCAHQSLKLYSDGTSKKFRTNVKSDLFTNDLLGSRPFHCASFMFRREIIEFNKPPITVISEDKLLYLLCSLQGKIRFFEKTMCIYRIHKNSVTNNWNFEYIKRNKIIPTWLHSIDSRFPRYYYLSDYYRTLFVYPKVISKKELTINFILYALYSFSIFPKNIRKLISLTEVYFNKLMNPSN